MDGADSEALTVEQALADLGSPVCERREAARCLLREHLGELEKSGDRARLRSLMDRLRRLSASDDDPEVRRNAEIVLSPFLEGGVRWWSEWQDLPKRSALLGERVLTWDPPSERVLRSGPGTPNPEVSLRTIPDWRPVWTRPLPPAVFIRSVKKTDEGILAVGMKGGASRWIGLFREADGEVVFQLSLDPSDPSKGSGLREPFVEVHPAGVLVVYETHLSGYTRDGTRVWRRDAKDLPGELYRLAVTRDGVLTGGALSAERGAWLGLFAIEDGRPLWLKTDLPGPVDVIQVLPDRAVAAGRCSVGSMGWIGAYGLKEGRNEWERKRLLDAPRALHPCPGGLLVSSSFRVERLSVSDGESFWTRPGRYMQDPVIDVVQMLGNGVFLAGRETNSGKGWAAFHEMDHGRKRWEYRGLPAPVQVCARVPDGILAAGRMPQRNPERIDSAEYWIGCFRQGGRTWEKILPVRMDDPGLPPFFSIRSMVYGLFPEGVFLGNGFVRLRDADAD